MHKLVVVGVLTLVLGLVLGNIATRQATRRHGQQLAVMWLADFHLQTLKVAAQRQDCALGQRATAHLHIMSEEMALAFPKADAQEQDFHRYLQQLALDTRPKSSAAVASVACAYDTALYMTIEEDCDNCHRDYR